MANFFWNEDTGVISSTLTGQTATQFQANRGDTLINLFVTSGDINTVALKLLDAGQQVGIVLRDPANQKAGYLAGPVILTRGATPADGYIGTLSTDTSIVQDFMGVNSPVNVPEAPSYPAAAAFYSEPNSGGAPVESQPIAWTITPPYYRPGTPPADIVQTYPSASQLTNAIALAGAAQPKLPTPSANGQILFGNTDGTLSFGGFPTSFPGDLTISGAITGASISGSGAGLTNLNPAALSGPVAVAQGGTGATSASAALGALGGAPLASPTFTGTVTIPAGAAIAGYATLANPTFTGTVTIPAGAAISGYATLANPTFTGTVTIPAGAAIAGYAALNSAPTFTGNATAPAFVGSGALLTNVAPFHPVTATATTFVPAAAMGSSSFHGSDVSGEITMAFSAQTAAGTLLGTIEFATPYTLPLPPTVILVCEQQPAAQDGTAQYVLGLITATLTTTGLQLYARTSGTLPSGGYKYQYFIPSA